MRLPKLVALIVAVGVMFVSGCTDAEIAWWHDPNVPQDVKDTVWAAMTAGPSDCYEAIDRYWPGDRAWARRIMWRESRNVPTARNRSGASGCFQMKLPLHAGRFTAVGCSPGQWADPGCNTRAAWNLYAASGSGPWRL